MPAVSRAAIPTPPSLRTVSAGSVSTFTVPASAPLTSESRTGNSPAATAFSPGSTWAVPGLGQTGSLRSTFGWDSSAPLATLAFVTGRPSTDVSGSGPDTDAAAGITRLSGIPKPEITTAIAIAMASTIVRNRRRTRMSPPLPGTLTQASGKRPPRVVRS
ncbi:hypothetical protein SMD20_35095 [Nonomuraea sp. LP-02]|uniref:hypothetical protein n=1 Tax=Nonomuraea sp. LP-02 TaxID=3097960 RepID=UPI002E331FE8|nr:hypothetical protein [Nonomuraea sp. LP-02]MED7929514.1 hypothetical protein [Nonomuraea sp. LP-02]